MTLSQRFINFLLSLYKSINRTGILNYTWSQNVFIYGYFTYKKYLEDTNAKLIINFPDIFRNGHILDIGANIGYTSYVFSKALSSPYKVFAFEPEKNNLKFLRNAANRFNFSNNLVITAAAVGDREGEIDLWQNEGHHADHRVLTDEFRRQFKDSFSVQKTPLISIDEFLRSKNITHPIAFIKIDVQGYELQVCKGMEQTLLANPDCVVGFEYCPSMIESLGYRSEDLIKFFQDRNYLFYRINKNGSLTPLNLHSDKNIKIGKNFPGYFDILCSLKNLN